MVSPTINEAVDYPKTLTKPQDLCRDCFPIEELCQGKCNNTKAVDSLTVAQSLKNSSQIISPTTIKAKL